MANFYGATALIGGGAGALDDIDGANLADGDGALVITPAGDMYSFVLDADSGLAESSPDVIMPDANAGDKRWIKKKVDEASQADDATDWDGAGKTVSTSAPSGGNDGDMWFTYIP